MSNPAPALVWFRQDLRLGDNPALHAAATGGRPLLGLYVLDDAAPGAWAMGAAQRWWLHGSLADLRRRLEARGVRLVLRRGDAASVVPEVAEAVGAAAVHWNRRYEPWGGPQDAAVAARLEGRGCGVHTHAALTLREPDEVVQKNGRFYKVYGAYLKAWLRLPPPRRPLPVPGEVRGWDGEAPSDDLAAWGLLPTSPDWAGGMRGAWVPGEAEALARLEDFVENGLAGYGDNRNAPGGKGTSRLSPYVNIGALSPHRVWHAAHDAAEARLGGGDAALPFLRELVWRDFAWATLHHLPHLPDRSLRPEFERYPWAEDRAGLRAWQRGRTGYPIVDAGMRELWVTGWMHNRLRLITGSFLTKDLGIHWREGERWYWDCLIDADLGNNGLNWQWVAGTGIDSSPWFRVFNPVGQGRRFDADAAYIRRWVPELAKLPDRHVHAPWEAPAEALAAAGVGLGETYPRPIVDHEAARSRAIEAYKSLRRAEAETA